MSWFWAALVAAILMTSINFLDKFIVSNRVPNSNAVLIFFGIANAIMALIVLGLTGFPILPAETAIPIMISGACIMLGNIFYLRAMSHDEASRIIVLNQLQPLFVLVLSILFLSEQPDLDELIGFGLILAAALALGLQRTAGKGSFTISGALWLTVFATIFWALGAISGDIGVGNYIVDFRTLSIVTGYASVGYALAGLGLYITAPPIRRAFHLAYAETGIKTFVPVFVVEGTFFVRQFAVFLAVSLGPVALVSIVGSTNVFFGILAGWILTLIAPKYFNEDIRRETLIRKGVWAGAMFVGLILIG